MRGRWKRWGGGKIGGDGGRGGEGVVDGWEK